MLLTTVALTSIALAEPAQPTVTEPTLAETLAAEMGPLEPAPVVQDDDGGASFSYSYIEAGGIILDVDATSEDVDSYYGRFSIGLFGFGYAFLGYENQSTDFQNTDSDLIRLGVGGHFSLTKNLDVLGDVAWLYNDVSSDLSTLDEDDNGYEIRAGGRWMPIDWDGGGVEINGGALWIDLDNRLASDDSEVGWELGARLHFLSAFSVGAGYTLYDDDDQIAFNARFSF